MNSKTKRNTNIKSYGSAIMSKAKEIRRKNPSIRWQDAVSQASKELKNKK